jgi:hypothetical protein
VINQPQYTILSDRGTAERSFVDSELSSCFKIFCGVHMTRNLKANRWTSYLPLFWNARNAPTRIQHHKCMEKIKSKCLPMYTDRWQLYLAIESGRMMYDWKSDNIVEHIFAWCRKARFLSPLMFIKHVVTEIFAAMNKHRCDIESISTVLHPQALQHFEVYFNPYFNQYFNNVMCMLFLSMWFDTVNAVHIHTSKLMTSWREKNPANL